MKHRLLSVFLIVAVMASAFAGAMAVSVLPAKAADPVTGYFDDLMDQARNYCPAASLTQFDNVVQQIHDNFDSWLVVIIYRPTDNSWYVASYIQDTSKQLNFWGWRNTYYYYFYPTYLNDPSSSHSFSSRYGFKIVGNNIWFEPYNNSLGNTTFNNDAFWGNQWTWSAPTPDDINESSRSCYTNIDLHSYNGTSEPVFLSANLINGSYVPPIIDFHWFKFQLGQRWYITTYDQSLVNMMVVEEDSFWAMWLDVRDNLDILTDYFVIWPDDMQRLPGAENFISQNLTNVSSSGVFAYDITDLVLNASELNDHLANAKFYSYSGTENDWLTNLVAESNDVVDLNLSPEEENESQNNAWNEISIYVENYPSVTISPQDLAQQLFGDTAYTGFMGDIRIPKSLGIKFSLFGQDINLCDAYFHYWLYQLGSGLGADENSILNFDLFNACVIAAPQVNRNVYVSNWTSTEDNVIDFDYIGLMDTQDLLDSFDLLLIAPAGSDWLKEVDSSILPFSGSSAAYTNLNQESVTTPRGVEGVYPVYIIVSQRAISKSQLYVFCDGFSKIYDLAVQFCDKRDLWDSSFLEWSMSIFWELETVNGHLFKIENEILGWKLSTQFELLFDKLETLSNNIVDPDLTDVDPWYLPLWNWVNRFAPSVNDFSNSIDIMDDTFDELPAIPQVTDPPAIPTLPGFD